MVYIAALGCRVGDINTHRLDRHKLPYLAFRDVTIRMVGGGHWLAEPKDACDCPE
jgi:hypothetical protein